MARVVYHVTPQAEGWIVKKEDAKRASSTHAKKAEAIQQAKTFAQGKRPSQVVVHKKDGTIQTEHTYGDDPRATRG